MPCNVILKPIKCILIFFFKKFEKCLRKNLDPPRKPAKNFRPPFETCEKNATPLEILRPQHVLLTGP